VEQELATELYRSRRYQRPLTLASIGRAGLNGHGETAAGELSGMLRAIDRVFDLDDHVLILLPETDRAGAEQLLERIATKEPGLLPSSYVALAVFPEDALTGSALMAAVTGATHSVGNGAENLSRPLERMTARFRRQVVRDELSA
jgi:hypothetical protein